MSQEFSGNVVPFKKKQSLSIHPHPSIPPIDPAMLNMWLDLNKYETALAKITQVLIDLNRR